MSRCPCDSGPRARAQTRLEPPSLWHNRDYVSWWAGSAFSTLGSNISLVAMPLLIVFTTGSLTGAGVIAAAGRLGSLVTVLWGGALADRVSRRLILVTVPLGQAALMAVVTWSVHTGRIAIALWAGVGLFEGMLAGIAMSATLPTLRRIVPREQFAARAAQQQGVQQATQLVASPLAAYLVTAVRWLPFGLDAASFVLASAGASLIRRPLGPDASPPRTSVPPAGGSRQTVPGRSVIRDIREGLVVVSRNGFLRYTLSWVAVTNMVGNSVMLLLIALLRQRGMGPRTIGLTNCVVLAGGIIGALLCGRIIKALGSRRVFLAGGWIYVATLGLAAVAPASWAAAAAVSLFVFTSVPTASVWEAYTVSLVPDRLTGRIGSVSSFAAQSLTWVGFLVAGWLVDTFDAPTAMLCFAGLLIPFAVGNHLATALTLLDTRPEHLQELA